MREAFFVTDKNLLLICEAFFFFHRIHAVPQEICENLFFVKFTQILLVAFG